MLQDFQAPLAQLRASWNGTPFIQQGVICLILGLVTLFLIVREVFKPPHLRSGRNGKPWKVPNGPSGLPIFGSVFEMRKGLPTCMELLKYGEMATVQLGSKTWVVLNSTRVTNELINKRGAITNERPPYPVASGLISHNQRSVLLPTAQWSERRRVMHQLLSGTATKKYAEYQDLESKQMLGEYVCRPSEWYNHHARYSNSVINRIAFGRRVLRMTPKLVDIYKVIISFVINNPPGNIIDCFPELAKLPKPLQWWRKKWEKVGALTTKVYQAYWIPIRKEIEEGRAEPCFARDVLIGEDAKYSGNDEASMYLAGQLVEAGSDTTRASLNIFVMAAICFPGVYLKARAEIDALCGKNGERFPTFDDEPNLPYVHALIKELLRWRPIFTWSPEHVLTEDLEFEGYRFPKGAAFMINHQGLCQNPDEFVDPDVVKPERWLNGRETDILHGVTSFGGGRRVCVGYKLAHKSLFINLSRLIYCIDYKRGDNVDSRNLNHHLQTEPFSAIPSIRSEAHKKLIISEAESADVWRFAKGEFTNAGVHE